METGSEAKKPFIPPRVMAGLTLAIVFVFGGVAGAALDRIALRRHHSRLIERVFSPPSEKERHQHAAKMAKDLGLTPAQAAAVDTIFAARSRQLDLGRERFEAELRTLMAATRHQIDSLLTPDQRAKLEVIRRQHGHSTKGP